MVYLSEVMCLDIFPFLVENNVIIENFWNDNYVSFGGLQQCSSFMISYIRDYRTFIPMKLLGKNATYYSARNEP